MNKPHQRFAIGQQVIHLGNSRGERKGEIYTIIDFDFSGMECQRKYCWNYTLNAKIDGYNIGALPKWLAPLPKDNEVSGETLQEIMKHYKENGRVKV